MTVIERFLRYVSFPTTSDENSETVPSNEKELNLARQLVQELTEIGVADACVDEFGRVYGHLPATPGRENLPVYGLISHMDTSPDASGENIKPRMVEYTGGDIVLNETQQIVMRQADFPCLERYIGQTLIVTDGTTLLGADDKAGVAEIMTALAYLHGHPEVPHGTIAVAFTPDEEIGCGADHFDYDRFHADFAYTVDGGALGEVEYENFNAANAGIKIQGRNIHPGSAKNIMKNAILLASEFIGMLPPAETPAHTEGYEGFYHVNYCNAVEENGYVNLIIRDHDRAKFEERKAFLQRTVDYLNSVHGEGTFTLVLKDSYYNMREKIEPHMHLIDRAKAAFSANGVEPRVVPIRGGTDGARLSWEGLPCPNLSTGGENFHGVYEFASVQAMEKMVNVLVHLVQDHE
jgi:tripeptide aminopeptidase